MIISHAFVSFYKKSNNFTKMSARLFYVLENLWNQLFEKLNNASLAYKVSCSNNHKLPEDDIANASYPSLK